MPDRTIVALLGPADGATCTTPGCTLLGPCVECEERRHLAAVEDDERRAAFDALPGAGPDDYDDDEPAPPIAPNGCTRCDGFGGTEWEPCPECLGAEPG